MSAHVMDSSIYGDLFGSAEVRRIFSDEHLVELSATRDLIVEDGELADFAAGVIAQGELRFVAAHVALHAQ